jgi:hypothetical protein
MINFPAWVTPPTKCDTYSATLIINTRHGIIREETLWLTKAGWAKANNGTLNQRYCATAWSSAKQQLRKNTIQQ